MKVLGFAVIAVLAIGAFTSIPNVSAIGEYGDIELKKAHITSQTGYGSALGKVCGLELCDSKSIPELTIEEKENIVATNPSNRALDKALQGAEASAILADYLKFKGIEIVETEVIETNSTSDFNAFANPEFYNPTKTHSTVMKVEVDEPETIIEVPSYMKSSYANPDHPVYVPKVKVVEEPDMKETLDEYCALSPEGQAEMIEKHDYSKHEDRIAIAAEYCLLDEEGQKAMIESFKTEYNHDDMKSHNMTAMYTDEQADMILFNLGFDIDVSKVGICGPGTELINGICLIDGEVPENVNTDWADYWDTKEEEVPTLEDVMLTDGEEAIPVVENGDVEEPMEGEGSADSEDVTEVSEPIKEEIVIETLTTVPVEPIQEPEPFPEPENERVQNTEPVDEESGFDNSAFE